MTDLYSRILLTMNALLLAGLLSERLTAAPPPQSPSIQTVEFRSGSEPLRVRVVNSASSPVYTAQAEPLRLEGIMPVRVENSPAVSIVGLVSAELTNRFPIEVLIARTPGLPPGLLGR